MADLKEKDGLL